jgi:hypothetical protein
MNQYQLILDYIEKHGSITTMEAFVNLGITKLSTRISEMIRRGVKITKVSVTVPDRRGKLCRVTRYGKAA